MNDSIVLSTLGHTWILDLDGTIVKHNGYKTDGVDSLLPGAIDFLNSIPPKDMVIFLTARKSEYKDMTEKFLRDNGIRFDFIIYDAPYGERILVNDKKPSGLNMGMAINTQRDIFGIKNVIEDEKL